MRYKPKHTTGTMEYDERYRHIVDCLNYALYEVNLVRRRNDLKEIDKADLNTVKRRLEQALTAYTWPPNSDWECPSPPEWQGRP